MTDSSVNPLKRAIDEGFNAGAPFRSISISEVHPREVTVQADTGITRLDRLIEAVRSDRAAFQDKASGCAGDHDRRGYGIEAAACAIREKALLDARRAVLGRVDPGFEFRPQR